jgi:hypothetical protein
MGWSARSGLLDAIGRHPRPDGRFYKIVVRALSDPDARVRNHAIHQVTNIGPSILPQAATDLQRLAVDPNETPDNRAAAQAALLPPRPLAQ